MDYESQREGGQGCFVVAVDQFSDCNGSHFKFTAVRE